MSEKKTIELSSAISIDGAQVSVLTMREPTVLDQLAMDRSGGSDAEKELNMIAALCMVKPTDLHQLTLRDYKKVTAAFVGFID